MNDNDLGMAPDFCLVGIDEGGIEGKFCLKDLLHKEKTLVLYFYPKDDTPGCTAEACDFRDNLTVLSDKATVIGISPDSIMSHKKFKEKHGLNFMLLSDPGHKILEAYGTWEKKSMYGKRYFGVIRSTFLISPEGKIEKAWRNVKVKGHASEILKALDL